MEEEVAPAPQPEGGDSVSKHMAPKWLHGLRGEHGEEAESQPGGLKGFNWGPSVNQLTNTEKGDFYLIDVCLHFKRRWALYKKG